MAIIGVLFLLPGMKQKWKIRKSSEYRKCMLGKKKTKNKNKRLRTSQ